MRIVAVISQKGRAGKTTLALHIPVASELAGYSTVLIDMAPQGTAEAWSEWRNEAPPTVVPAKTATLGRTLERAGGHGAEFAVIDTPPLAEPEGRRPGLVPCLPNAFDLHSIRTTTDLTRFAAKPAFVTFNAGPVAAARLYAENRTGERNRYEGCADPTFRARHLSTFDRQRAGGAGDRAAR